MVLENKNMDFVACFDDIEGYLPLSSKDITARKKFEELLESDENLTEEMIQVIGLSELTFLGLTTIQGGM